MRSGFIPTPGPRPSIPMLPLGQLQDQRAQEPHTLPLERVHACGLPPLPTLPTRPHKHTTVPLSQSLLLCVIVGIFSPNPPTLLSTPRPLPLSSSLSLSTSLSLPPAHSETPRYLSGSPHCRAGAPSRRLASSPSRLAPAVSKGSASPGAPPPPPPPPHHLPHLSATPHNEISGPGPVPPARRCIPAGPHPPCLVSAPCWQLRAESNGAAGREGGGGPDRWQSRRCAHAHSVQRRGAAGESGSAEAESKDIYIYIYILYFRTSRG